MLKSLNDAKDVAINLGEFNIYLYFIKFFINTEIFEIKPEYTFYSNLQFN